MLCFFPQLKNFQHADFVGQRLTGHDEIALDLSDHLQLRHAGIGEHVVDGLLARPAFGVYAGIDHQTHRAEDFCLKSAQIIQRIFFIARFPCQPFRIKRPTLGISGKWNHASKNRQAFELPCNRDLQVMARHRFVIGQCAHREFGDFIDLSQADIEHARFGTIKSRPVVIGERGSLLRHGRHTLHDHFCFRLDAEQGVEPGGHFFDDSGIALEHFRASGVVV